MIGTFTHNRLYLYHDTVVISDLHLPDGEPSSSRWEAVLEKAETYSTLIINGDFLTGFPPSETALLMLEDVSSKYDTVRYHFGNHEDMTVPANKNLSLKDIVGSKADEYDLQNIDVGQFSTIDDSVLVTHGHRFMVDISLEGIDQIVLGHIHPSHPAKTPVALSVPFRFDENIPVIVCPAFGEGISNFSYKDQNRMNDFIEDIPKSTVLKSFTDESTEET